MSDLAHRLRSVDCSWSEVGEWCAEAADRIEALEARCERLEGVLRRTITLAENYASGTGTVFAKGMDDARAALEEAGNGR